MDLSDEDIIITNSQDLSDESQHSGTVEHEEEEIFFRTFEDQGVSIIKKPNLPPCIEVHDQASQDIMRKSGIEFVTCYLEDVE